MSPCRTCFIVQTPRKLCHYCAKTVALIQADRCVACQGPLDRTIELRFEGRCADCRSLNVVLSQPTRTLLALASRARYRQRQRTAA